MAASLAIAVASPAACADETVDAIENWPHLGEPQLSRSHGLSWRMSTGDDLAGGIRIKLPPAEQ